MELLVEIILSFLFHSFHITVYKTEHFKTTRVITIHPEGNMNVYAKWEIIKDMAAESVHSIHTTAL